MVTGFFEFAGGGVDGAAEGAIAQTRAQVMMVNAPTQISLKCSRSVIPPAKLLALGRESPKGIGKTQVQHMLPEGLPLGGG